MVRHGRWVVGQLLGVAGVSVKMGSLGCVHYLVFGAGGNFPHIYSGCLSRWKGVKALYRQFCSGIGDVTSSYAGVFPNFMYGCPEA